MAKFRDMKKFTELVGKYNDNNGADGVAKAIAKSASIEYSLWIKKSKAIDSYSSKYNVEELKAEEILSDALDRDYSYLSITSIGANQEDRLSVTTKGRHLLERGGVMRAWANDNKNIATLVLALISGVVIGGISVLVALLQLMNR